MRRRLILALAAALLAAAPPALAQSGPRPARVGLLSSGAAQREAPFVEAFRAGLRESGWSEGRHLVLDVRYGEGDFGRLPRLAAELVASKVDVVVAAGAPAVEAAVTAARGQTPIVMTNTADPVGLGLVASLARSGNNVTGLSDLNTAVIAKRVQLLKEAVPGAARLGVLMNPGNPTNAPQVKLAETAAAEVGLATVTFAARRPDDVERAFTDMKARRIDSLVVVGDPFLASQDRRIVALAVRHKIPHSVSTSQWMKAGALLSYGTDFADLYRRAAGYVDRILKGARPAELPIEQPTKLELAVNLKTARALGLTIPGSILSRADRVIE